MEHADSVDGQFKPGMDMMELRAGSGLRFGVLGKSLWGVQSRVRAGKKWESKVGKEP